LFFFQSEEQIMSDPKIKCPHCESEKVAQQDGMLRCQWCGHSFEPAAAIPPPLKAGGPEDDVDERIRKAVAEALRDADARARKMADQAVGNAISEVTAGVTEQFREQGERWILIGYVNLLIGAIGSVIGLCLYRSDPNHPDMLVNIPVLF
jgi:uncharacterized Zn finger protein (UPF0148 family)